MKKICLWGTAILALASCTPKQQTVSMVDKGNTGTTVQGVVQPVALEGQQPLAMVLKASVFKMSGDYADKVAVTLGNDGNLVYYPATTDVSESSAPTQIGEGWWLNRQGLGPNSVFTKWTFAEYHALPKTPTPSEIKAAILPDAVVTEFQQLQIPASQAATMSAAELLPLINK